jgi:hypothetical protein
VSIGAKTFVNKPIRFEVTTGDRVILRVEDTRAVLSLTQREKQEAGKLRAIAVGGTKVVQPVVTLIAAKIAGLPLSLACAILEQETAGGRNEWGHDPTIFIGGFDEAHNRQYPESPLTRAAYEAYKAQRGPEDSRGGAPNQQGVGPGQLTTAWKQNQADDLGGAWKPLPNLIEAFALLKESIQRDGLRSTVVGYNGSGPKAEAYADVVLQNERRWAQALGKPSIQDR